MKYPITKPNAARITDFTQAQGSEESAEVLFSIFKRDKSLVLEDNRPSSSSTLNTFFHATLSVAVLRNHSSTFAGTVLPMDLLARPTLDVRQRQNYTKKPCTIKENLSENSKLSKKCPDISNKNYASITSVWPSESSYG